MSLGEPYVLETFAGPGGWSEGLRALGLKGRGIDSNPDACATGTAAGHYRHLGNVATMNPLDVLMPWGSPTGLIGSPPCPGFSHGGLKRGLTDAALVLEALEHVDNRSELETAIASLDRRMTDDRTLLALEPLRWALALGPEWIALEQVPYVLPLWQAVARILEGFGYSTATAVLHAEQYGVPQVRRRAVLVARSAEATLRLGPAALPSPSHSRFYPHDPIATDEGLPRPVSMASALGWGMTHRPYPAISAGTARGGQDPGMLGGSGAREAVRRELEAGRWQTSAEHPVGPGDEWNLDTRRALRLSHAEAGALQTFPRDYPWQGKPTARFRQIADAVPPVLARRIIARVCS
jgi:DNA (cytosine-5)-methyltransferase 1